MACGSRHVGGFLENVRKDFIIKVSWEEANFDSDYSSASTKLALGSSPGKTVGTRDSQTLVVSGVNSRWGDKNESAVIVRVRPVAGPRPHNPTKIKGCGHIYTQIPTPQ